MALPVRISAEGSWRVAAPSGLYDTLPVDIQLSWEREMYDKCKAGLGFCLIVGGTVISGWWVIGIALALVLAGVLAGRYLYNRTNAVEDDNDDC